MVDKVKPLKMEDSASGTEINPFPTEADPTEDYLTGKGLALENLDTHLIDRSGNDIQFTDPNLGTKTATQLRTDIDNSFDGSGASPTFTATDVRNAIIEARDTAEGTTARFGVLFGNLGNTKNKWLEYFPGSSSETSPFFAAEALDVVSISAYAGQVVTGEMEIYKNAVLFYTVDFVATDKVTETGLTLSFAADDEISVFVTNSAAMSSPTITLFAKVVI